MTTHDYFLKSYLAEQDVACPSCGYNLRGLTIRACPECNEALQLRVGLAEPKMKLWLATVLGLAFGVGFSLLVTIHCRRAYRAQESASISVRLHLSHFMDARKSQVNISHWNMLVPLSFRCGSIVAA